MPTNSIQDKTSLRHGLLVGSGFRIAACSYLIIAVLFIAAGFSPAMSYGQEQRSVLKPSIEPPSVVDRTREAESEIKGITFVSVPPILESVFKGREPASLQELRALEKQQSRIAQSIETVTVNVRQGAAQGSGVIITADGYVLTAAHVAGRPDQEAWVVLSDGRQVRARTLGLNRDKDAGLLKIVESSPTPWPHATLGQSSRLREGQWVVAAGHPGGWNSDRGAVIRVGRVLSIVIGEQQTAHTLFTDCALIGGDSGGPLFSLDGKLVGIHSRIGTDVVDNMHVPIDVFGESWDRLVRKEAWGNLPGYTSWIGVKGTAGDDRPIISQTERRSPAKRAGLDAGDLILTVDGERISTFDELRLIVMERMPGDTIRLTVQRGQQILQISVTIDSRPESDF